MQIQEGLQAHLRKPPDLQMIFTKRHKAVTMCSAIGMDYFKNTILHSPRRYSLSRRVGGLLLYLIVELFLRRGCFPASLRLPC